ncbi:unnamed protein product [Echinostoma caproni]|uniref:PDCD2_C domain-containing protein n=1 Tax=Echinostoma caproni TaxID=27848 RepID=A0A183A0H3_9TREM|nr:unnamed protein product [Echinostoma caproni]
MKKFAKFLLVSANGVGELKLGVDVETLACVRLHFRGLRARSWLSSTVTHPVGDTDEDGVLDPRQGMEFPIPDVDANEEPRSAVWSDTGRTRTRGPRIRMSDTNDDIPDLDELDESELDMPPPDHRFVSVSLDIRRVGQLMASPRINASYFVCSKSCAARS